MNVLISVAGKTGLSIAYWRSFYPASLLDFLLIAQLSVLAEQRIR